MLIMVQNCGSCAVILEQKSRRSVDYKALLENSKKSEITYKKLFSESQDCSQFYSYTHSLSSKLQTDLLESGMLSFVDGSLPAFSKRDFRGPQLGSINY